MGETANPVTEPRYMPLYTSESALLLSDTGIHLESILFIAGIATPCNKKRETKDLLSTENSEFHSPKKISVSGS